MPDEADRQIRVVLEVAGTKLHAHVLTMPYPALCSIIFCEAVAIYGIIVAIILQTKIDWVPPSPDTGLWSNESYLAGYAIFASGLTTGWANLACG